METILEQTGDGSHTLFVPQLNEHYHSVNGAVRESRHVFIETGLHAIAKEKVRIFEVGFGTGLNAFLSYLDALQCGKDIHYTSIELYPLSEDTVASLNYPALLWPGHEDVFRELHHCAWNQQAGLSDFFHLTKLHGDLLHWPFSGSGLFDLVFFDAFAPDKQPEMWQQAIFDQLFSLLSAGGVFVTYCAKGVVRRMLQTSGFEVERLPGPPGKREMLRARKPPGKE